MFLKSHTLLFSFKFVYVTDTGDRNKNELYNSSCKIHLFCSTNAVKIWGEQKFIDLFCTVHNLLEFVLYSVNINRENGIHRLHNRCVCLMKY